MNQQYLTQETFHAFLSEIIDQRNYAYDDDEELQEHYELLVERNTSYQDFFQDSTVMTRDKVEIMFMMSRDNLKFHDLENVDDNDHQQLHRLLIEMFSDTPTEDNELRMVHVLACMVNEKPDNVISNLIDTSATERQAIFMERMGDSEYTALHEACCDNASADTINTLIAIGGRELVMMINTYECTALHLACCDNASADTINALIAIGGRELVMMINDNGRTALHIACHNNVVSIDTINAIIAIGGRELVMMIDYDGYTALHWAYNDNASFETINALIAIGGRELVMMINAYERTALHEACFYNTSVEIINALIDIGGNLLLIANDNEGNFPLVALLNSHQSTNRINNASSLISSGIIQDQVGGEFGIGGLFNFASEEGQQRIFDHWNNTILPALEMNAALISRQPILQAAIIARAPLHIIQDIISRFDCIATQDSRGRYPIDVAVAEGLEWGDGMEDIVRAHTEASIVDLQGQARLMINVAALHGLKWENGMEEVSVESREEVGNADALTGLFPFMLAAAGESSDLSSIYELMLQSLDSF